MTKRTLYLSYYAFLGLVIAGAALVTVVDSSRFVAFGSNISRLEAQRALLVRQQALLHQQLAGASSLQQATQYASMNAYHPVSQPVVVSVPSTLASR